MIKIKIGIQTGNGRTLQPDQDRKIKEATKVFERTVFDAIYPKLEAIQSGVLGEKATLSVDDGEDYYLLREIPAYHHIDSRRWVIIKTSSYNSDMHLSAYITYEEAREVMDEIRMRDGIQDIKIVPLM